MGSSYIILTNIGSIVPFSHSEPGTGISNGRMVQGFVNVLTATVVFITVSEATRSGRWAASSMLTGRRGRG